VGEETGWRVVPSGIIGYRHFHQLEPDSIGNDRPYPDFVQSVYAAQVGAYDENLLIQGDHLPAAFIAFNEAMASTGKSIVLC